MIHSLRTKSGWSPVSWIQNQLFDTTYLYSKNLTEEQVGLVLDYYKAGFPDLVDFAESKRTPLATLAKRLTRIETKLGVTNKAQLGSLITTLAMHSKLELAAKNELVHGKKHGKKKTSTSDEQ